LTLRREGGAKERRVKKEKTPSPNAKTLENGAQRRRVNDAI